MLRPLSNGNYAAAVICCVRSVLQVWLTQDLKFLQGLSCILLHYFLSVVKVGKQQLLTHSALSIMFHQPHLFIFLHYEVDFWGSWGINGVEILYRNITVKQFLATICYVSQVNREAQCQEDVNLFNESCNLIFGSERVFL